MTGSRLKKWVINLSKHALTSEQKSVLGKGLNFAVSPENIPVDEIITATELACSKLPPCAANDLRAEIVGKVRTARKPEPNISKGEQKAIQELKRLDDLVIIGADKGKATVVLDKCEYDSKVKDMLSDESTYEKLSFNPTARYKKKLVEILQRLSEEKKINRTQYDYLYPTSESTPRLYCTPKIHKPDVPLRPIVDYTGSIAYNVSRSLADLLSPLVGNSGFHVPNSKDLAEELKDFVINEDEMFVSHDVVSLFKKTPINESLDIIRSRLVCDKSLGKRTHLEVDDIVTLLDFVLNTTYFQYGGEVYRQKFGAAMGSPVSPIVCNIFMEDLEQKAVSTAPEYIRPRLWKRYVDDILEVVKQGAVSDLTSHLNGIDPTGSIKFTHEEESNGSLAFLDMLISRRPDGSLKLQVYRKKTHTDQYLHFHSAHPLQHKLGVVRTLYDRNRNLVTLQQDQALEKQHIDNALKQCGYPKWAMEKVGVDMNNPRGRNNREETPYGTVVIPYVKGLSESLRRSYGRYNFQTAMKPVSTLRNILVHPKDKRSMEDQCNVIYKIPCKSCKSSYIGQTGRNFGYRLKEHRQDVDRTTAQKRFTRAEKKASLTEFNKSAITDHAVRENHIIDWDSAKILESENNQSRRLLKESIWINKTAISMNRDEGGKKIPRVYDVILRPASGSTH